MKLTDVFYDFKDAEKLDFDEVVDVDLGESYEWDEFHAWFSPSRRMYFWASGAGCSCNSIDDRYAGIEDLEYGHERSNVLAALNRYFDEAYGDVERLRIEALATANMYQQKRVSDVV